MNLEQVGIVAILLGMLVCFALERPKIEVTALCGLGLAFLFGIVPAGSVFSGIANPAVITVIEILIIVQAVGRTPFVGVLSNRIQRLRLGRRQLTLALCALTGTISVFVNNIGAFVMMLPIALSLARSAGIDPRQMIMPISFAALLGGLGSVIGTPANLLVSNALEEQTGRGFAFFDFAWVGLPVALAGLCIVAFWSAPRIGRTPSASQGQQAIDRQLTTEFAISETSSLVSLTPREIQFAKGAQILSVLRAGQHVFGRPEEVRLMAGDLCVVRVSHSQLEDMIETGDVAWEASSSLRGLAEIVVTPGSLLVGSLPRTAAVFEEFDIKVCAVATRTTRIEGRLFDLRLSVGDILYVIGERGAVLSAVNEADALLVSPSRAPEGPVEGTMLPLTFFAAGIAMAASGLLAPEIAFGATVLALLVSGQLDLRSSLADLDWPILIMLAAMIPLGEAVQTTGMAELLAAAIIDTLPAPGIWPLSLAMLFVAVIITPFVNNATTAIILAPIALSVSAAAGIAAQPLLMAVAIGASIDFVTPFGHHNNTLAMSLGGYRFRDFVKAGGPLTVVAMVMAALALGLFWL